MNAAVEGTDQCDKHGGSDLVTVQATRSYYLTQALIKDGVERRTASVAEIGLESEIAILQELLQHTVEQCISEAYVLLYTERIIKLTETIERLKKSNYLLRLKQSEVLDRSVLINFARDVVSILSDELPDMEDKGEVLDRIAHRLKDSIVSLRNG